MIWLSFSIFRQLQLFSEFLRDSRRNLSVVCLHQAYHQCFTQTVGSWAWFMKEFGFKMIICQVHVHQPTNEENKSKEMHLPWFPRVSRLFVCENFNLAFHYSPTHETSAHSMNLCVWKIHCSTSNSLVSTGNPQTRVWPSIHRATMPEEPPCQNCICLVVLKDGGCKHELHLGYSTLTYIERPFLFRVFGSCSTQNADQDHNGLAN